MKRLIFLSTLLIFALASTAQPLLIPKGVKAITHVITPTEVSYLHGVTGPIETTFLKVSDGVLATDYFMSEDTTEARLAKKANIYQPSLVNPTVTTQAAGDNSTKAASTAFVYRAVRDNSLMNEYKSLGANAICFPMFAYTAAFSATMPLVDGTAFSSMIEITETKTATGIAMEMASPTGAYTADNFNGFVLFSLSGTAMTEIARTADTPLLWKATAFSITYTPFVSSVSLAPGKYIIIGVWNASATTTIPIVASFGTLRNGFNIWASGLKPQGSLASQNTIPSSLNQSSFTAATNIPAFWPY